MEVLVGVVAAGIVCAGAVLVWQVERRVERMQERQRAREAALVQMCRDMQEMLEAQIRRDVAKQERVLVGRGLRAKGVELWVAPVQWVRLRGGWFVEVVLQ